jgi:hypothetical protein
MVFIFKSHVGCEEFLLTFKNEANMFLEPSRTLTRRLWVTSQKTRILNHNSVKTSKTHIPPPSDENLGSVNYPTTVTQYVLVYVHAHYAYTTLYLCCLIRQNDIRNSLTKQKVTRVALRSHNIFQLYLTWRLWGEVTEGGMVGVNL